MPNIPGSISSSGRQILYNPEVASGGYGDVGYNTSPPVVYVNYKPYAVQNFPYKQEVKWYGQLQENVTPYTNLGSEFLIGSTYSNDWQAAQFSVATTNYSMYAGQTYRFVIKAKSLGVTYSGGAISIVAKTRPENLTSITAAVSGSTVSASWSAVNAGGHTSVSYYWSLWKDGSFYTSSSTTGTSISYGNMQSGTYVYKIYTGNPVGLNASSMITSNSVTVVGSPATGFRCTSLDRAVGNCPTVGCCSYQGSGAFCSSVTC